MKILVYEGPQMLPMAQPFICSSMLFNVNSKAKNVVMTFAANVQFGQFQSDVFTAFTSSGFEILVCNDFAQGDEFVQMNIKLFNVDSKAKNIVMTFVATVQFGQFQIDIFTAFISSAFGILICNNFTIEIQVRSHLGHILFYSVF